MGKNKLKIEKISTNEGRKATYSKRKGGILKKAKELSILCDADVLLLAFSNTGKPSLCLGENSFEETIEKYAKISPQERKKKKSEALEGLKKTYQKTDHEVHIDQFLDQETPRVEDLQKQAEVLNNEITKSYQLLGPLGCLTNLGNIENVGVVSSLEDTLKGMITRNRIQKESYDAKVIDLTNNELDQCDEPSLYQNVSDQQLDQNDEWLLFDFNDNQPCILPQTNTSNNNSGDFLSLPQNAISDTEFVDNMIDQELITFENLHGDDLTLPDSNSSVDFNSHMNANTAISDWNVNASF